MFGGERFVDYVSRPSSHAPICLHVNKIGEISIMKDMTTVATTMMTEEEKAELERQLNGETEANSSKAPHSVTNEPAAAQPTTKSDAEKPVAPDATHKSSTTAENADSSPVTPHAEDKSGTKSPTPSKVAREKQKEAALKKQQSNAEQREKLKSQEVERRKRMEARIKTLTEKLVERLRPFVEAERPGDDDDQETKVFREKMRREAEDLKLESFGVEVIAFLFRHGTI